MKSKISLLFGEKIYFKFHNFENYSTEIRANFLNVKQMKIRSCKETSEIQFLGIQYILISFFQS